MENNRIPQYGDFVDIPDFQSAMNAVIGAQRSFDALPANVRKRFANSPQALMEFMSDPENRDEAVRLGLVNPPSASSSPTPEGAAPTPAQSAS